MCPLIGLFSKFPRSRHGKKTYNKGLQRKGEYIPSASPIEHIFSQRLLRDTNKSQDLPHRTSLRENPLTSSCHMAILMQSCWGLSGMVPQVKMQLDYLLSKYLLKGL